MALELIAVAFGLWAGLELALFCSDRLARRRDLRADRAFVQEWLPQIEAATRRMQAAAQALKRDLS